MEWHVALSMWQAVYKQVGRGGTGTGCLVPKPHYYARPMRFGSRGPAVRLGYVTECIDREGLERRRTGTRQGDGDIATRVWGLGTWGRETRDLTTSSLGRRDVWDADTGTSNTGTQGTRDVNNYCKSRR